MRAIPGHLEALHLLAKTKYISNEDEAAQRLVEQCLKLNPTYAEVLVLQLID